MTSIKDDGIIDDDDKYRIQQGDICYNTEELLAIDRLICAKEFANIDQGIYAWEIITNQDNSSSDLYNGAVYSNDEATATSTSTVNPSQCVRIQPSNSPCLPVDIYKLFPGRNEKEIINILKKAQDKTDKIWAEIDNQYKKYRITSQINSQMCRKFKIEFQSYLSKEFPTQVNLINAARSILDQSSFGILFCNGKNEIFGVQNHYGTWSAMKGHRRIKDDGTLETEYEACIRELFEELSIKFMRSKSAQTITKENIQLIGFNQTNFLQCHVDSRPNANDKSRCIGLFCVRVDEKTVKFNLKDNKENKACGWLKINDILSNKPEGRDIYHTLRPFVQYLKDHLMY